jgi:hypothetical protein
MEAKARASATGQAISSSSSRGQRSSSGSGPRGSSSSGEAAALSAGILAARALYVMEVTRREPRWADWNDDGTDNSQISPQVGQTFRVWVLLLWFRPGRAGQAGFFNYLACFVSVHAVCYLVTACLKCWRLLRRKLGEQIGTMTAQITARSAPRFVLGYCRYAFRFHPLLACAWQVACRVTLACCCWLHAWLLVLCT